jgi:hypothetical protein
VVDADEVMPVRVPEAMEATVVDSPAAAAVAAMLPGTSMMFEAVVVVDGLVLVEVVLEVTS